MRILHLIPSLSGGGAERQLSYLAAEQARLGYEVNIGYLYDGPSRPDHLPETIAFHRIQTRSHYSPLIIWQIIRLLRQVQPDLVQTWLLLMDIVGGFAARMQRKTWVLSECSTIARYNNYWKYRLRARAGAHANAVISNSRGGDQYWQNFLRENCRHIIPNGIPLDAIVNTPQGLLADSNLPNSGDYIMFAGRLELGKNLENLLKALAIVRERKPIEAVVCGDGSQRETIKMQINSLNLSGHVHMPGYIPNEQVWSLLKSAAAFTFLSEFEGMPNAVLEAMTCRCPLLVSDIPAHRAFLDESIATFVDHSNPHQVANAIIETIETRDESRIEKAWYKANTFSIPSMTNAFDQVYRDMLSLRSVNKAEAEA